MIASEDLFFVRADRRRGLCGHVTGGSIAFIGKKRLRVKIRNWTGNCSITESPENWVVVGWLGWLVIVMVVDQLLVLCLFYVRRGGNSSDRTGITLMRLDDSCI